MQQYKTLEISEEKNGVVHVRLNRPEKHNALSAEMITELTDFATRYGGSDTTRAIVLTGAGKTFCAGGDLGWMHDQINADRKTRIKEAKKLAMMLHALNTMPTPLIGAIHGGAYGGGIGLACVCDVAIASNDAKFGFTETKLGLIPATISPYVLARIGEGHARRVFMSSRIFDASEAEKLGVVARVVPHDDISLAIEAEVAPYLGVAPQAVGHAKNLARRLGPEISPELIEETINLLADVWESEEAQKGLAAFLEKRPPEWAKAKES